MHLIIGLGNPGKKYEFTRHNVGFWLLDNFFEAKKEIYPENCAGFNLNKKFQSQIAKIGLSNFDDQTYQKNSIEQDEIILAKPETFMNLSGQAAKTIKDFYKIPLENILVIQDELDLALGKFKFSKNSGPAGHNGIKSLIKNLGSKNFTRLRIGIAPHESEEKREEKKENFSAEKFVLNNFSSEERKVLDEIKKDLIEAIEFFVQNDFEKTADKFN